MKRPVNTGIRYWTYLLISLLFVSTRLIASPYLLDCGYDDRGHSLHNRSQVGYQFNRMSDPVDLSKDHLRVLPILLIPSDLTPTDEVKGSKAVEIRTFMREVQTFFQNEMAAGGYLNGDGTGKTFEIVKDASDQVLVYQKVGENSRGEYDSWAQTWSGNLINNIYPDLRDDTTLQADHPADKTLYFVVMLDVDYNGGIALADSPSSGICVVSTQNLNWALTIHELGHAFGLSHDWRKGPVGDDSRQKYYILGYRWFGKSSSDIILSDLAKAILDGSQFFNRSDFDSLDPGSLSAPKIEITSSDSYSTGLTTHQVGFTISDSEGLHMVAFYGKVDVASGYANSGNNGDKVPISSTPGESFSPVDGTSYTSSYSFRTHESATTDAETFYSPGSASHQAEARQVYVLAIDKTGKQTWQSILLYHEDRTATTHTLEAGEELNAVLYSSAWPKDEIILTGDTVESESIYIYKDRLTISSADPANPRRIPVPVRIEGAKSIRLSSLSMPAIYIASDSSNITIDNCEISASNSYPYVGVDIGQDATVTLINTLIYDHNVGIQSSSGDATIINSTIVGNYYGLDSSGANNTINISNTIFALNTVDWQVEGSSVITNSLFDESLPAGISTDAGNLSGDPQFQDASNRDYRLQVGSPAIDAGDGSVSGLPTRDKVGNQRIFGNQVDIGAYEHGSSPQPVPHKLVFSSSVQTIFVGQDSGKITAQLQEQDNSPIDAVGNLVVDLASSSSAGIFSAEAGGVAITSITIADGDNEVDFYYRDTVAGNVTLTATATIGTAQKSATQTMTVNSVTIVAISDANLRSKLESVLNKATGDEITQQELAELTELDASGLSISDLTGLQHCTKLTRLVLWDNDISDISIVSSLTNLTDLDLGGNQISNSDLSVLSSLTNLTSLSLAYNGISDLSVLSYLTNLTGLLLHGNQISNSDLSVLSSLTNLTSLVLEDNNISDISILSSLTNLTNLDLGINQISDSDLSVLSSLTKLTSLSLWNNQISHIGALSNLTNLTELKLSNNPLTVSAGPTIQTLKDGGATVTHDSLLPIIPDLNLRAALESALGKTSGDSITEAELATLTALTATNRTISDLTGLEYCLNLTNLDLSGNDIVDITLLLSHSGLGSGDVIDLTGNPLTYDTYTTQIPILENKGVTVTSSTPSDAVFIPDGNLQAKLAVALGLSPNQLIPKARLSSSEFSSFSAQSSSIADLTGLEHAVNLTELSLEYNNISNIDVLSHLNQLSYLALSSNNINDISALSGLTNLDDVYLDNNQIRDIQPLVSNTGIDSDSDYVVLTGNPLSNVSFTQLIPQLESRSVIVEPAADTIGADVIDFADPKLEELIRSILNKPTELLTSTNTTGLTVLNAKNAGITDVAGLNQLTNLTSLDISFNPLSSVAVSTQIPDLQTSGVDVVHGVVRWSFEQQTGTAVSVLAQPATSGFDATPHGVPTWAPGLSGQKALKLDGVDDWVEIPNHNLINSGGPWANKTVTTVFRVDDASVVTRKQVIYEQGARTHGLNLYIHNGRLYVGGYNKEASENDWQGNWISTSVTSNTWYQAALVLRGGTDTVGEGGLELWLNGELVSTEPAAKLHGHTGGIGIGNANQSTVFHDGTGKQGTSHLFRGLINGVAIYNTALSETRLAGMTVGQLASLKAAWGPSAELPEKIIIGTETITKPIGQLTFSAINGGGSVTGITIDLSDEIMADSNDDGLDDLNTAVDPLAVTLHGYIGGNTAGDPDLTATPVDINGDKGFFFDLSSHSLSATGSQTDVPFYIELVVDPTQLNAGREKEVVQLSLSLSDIETTAVGGFRQAYDAYGQPDGHRWNDEFQPSLESPLEIEVELVKTQPLTVLPGFVQLRYQTGGTVKMYDPATEGWVTPALTLTNNTSTATTYNIHEAIRAAQPALVAVIPTDNDSANPLPSDSTDISNVKSMFAEDELTVEVNYSGDLPSKDRVVGKILLDTGRPVSSPAPKASQFGFGSNQTMDVDFVVELVRNGARVVAELTDTEDFGRIDQILVQQTAGQLSVRIPRLLLQKPDNDQIDLAVQLGQDWAPNQDQAAATVTFTGAGTLTPEDLNWLQPEANSVTLGIDEATKTESLAITMPTPPATGVHRASLQISDGNSFSFGLPVSLSVSANQLANLKIRPRTVGEDILLRVGDTYQFEVVGYDVNGLDVDIGGQTVAWTGASVIGTVDASGLFSATTVGIGRLQASASVGGVVVVGQSAQIEVIQKILGDSTGTTASVDYPDGQPDGKVDIFDLVNMASHWHQTEDDTTASVREFKDLDIAGKNAAGDGTGFDQVDQKIDIFDLIVLVDNYGTGLTPALAAPAILATLPLFEGGNSDLQVVATDSTSQAGDRVRTLLDQQIELDVLLNQVPDLYAYSFDLVYDQQRLDLVTQQDGQPVFQDGSILGTETEATHSIVSHKTADDGSQLASANVTATRLGHQPVDQQSGALGRLQLLAKTVGQTQLQVKNLILVTDSGETYTLADRTYDLTVHLPVEQSQLDQNYPNPFNPETWIPFQLKSASPVVISIYDTTGKMVRELDVGYRVAGPHHSRQEAAYWDGRNRWGEPVSSGVYFYHLKTNDSVSIKKMTVLK